MDTCEMSKAPRKDRLETCLPSQWMPKLGKSQVLPSLIIKGLPESFISYLCEDGIVLPEEQGKISAWSDDDWEDNNHSKENSKSNETDDQDSADEREYLPLEQRFPHFLCFLQNSMEQAAILDSVDIIEYNSNAILPTASLHKYTIFPKLAWSSPKDAGWITADGTIACTTLTDLFQLLKASDRTSAALNMSLEQGIQPELLLRPWRWDWEPSMEFRCIAMRKANENVFNDPFWLLAISQRDDTTCYEFLGAAKEKLVNSMVKAMLERTLPNLEDEDFAVDLYIDNGRVLVLDIAPICEESLSPILFEWEEIKNLSSLCHSSAEYGEYERNESNYRCIFRWIQQPNQCRLGKIARQNRLPIDLLNTVMYT